MYLISKYVNRKENRKYTFLPLTIMPVEKPHPRVEHRSTTTHLLWLFSFLLLSQAPLAQRTIFLNKLAAANRFPKLDFLVWNFEWVWLISFPYSTPVPLPHVWEVTALPRIARSGGSVRNACLIVTLQRSLTLPQPCKNRIFWRGGSSLSKTLNETHNTYRWERFLWSLETKEWFLICWFR